MTSSELLPRIPVSTYRLQLNHSFRFSDARKIVPYLRDLGISDVYLSPYFKAQKGSTHGYDITDPTQLNPEIGSQDDFDAFVDELRRHGMGQLLDIVPNHMCVKSTENMLWMDVLENGPSSVYACVFDIDWHPVKEELKNKVLLPILGDQYGDVLERQELLLTFEEGSFFIYYYDHKLPVRPQTYTYILQHRLSELEKKLSLDNPHYIELLSILTALRHLPGYAETDPERIAERSREKEVVKRRLWAVYTESPEVRQHLKENVLIFNGTKGDPRSFDLIDQLICEQVYRLAHWRVATEEINYRRFFDINHLGSVRTQEPRVFRETHRLTLALVREGKVTGLRVDHPDGLYDPTNYFMELQRSCFIQRRLSYIEALREGIEQPPPFSDVELELGRQYDAIRSENPQYKPFYIVGEKILTKGERMPEEWPIFSTTGYVFLNSLNGIFVDSRSAKAFDDLYARFTGNRVTYQELVYEKKKLVMHVAMSSEINALGHYLNTISEKNRHTRDFTLNSLTAAIIDVIALFPVYRTYTNSHEVVERDRQYIDLAVSKAKRRNPAVSASVFDFLRDVLTLRFPDYFSDDDRNEWLDFVMKFQQVTGPVMAKGLEDTVFYVYNRLVSLNEVGGSPERFGTPLETFHGQNIERSKYWPHALIATSTHDTKRSEDVRARINVLSEMPDRWRAHLAKWNRLNRRKKVVIDGQRVPDRNEEHLLYQSLVGVWPVGAVGQDEYAGLLLRIKEYMLKAVREAKVNTSWINPNSMYEDGLTIFIDRILSRDGENEFLAHFIEFQKLAAGYGMYNSLSQALLKVTCPGVPDFYQGAEIVDLSLVDPDNRRPVEYGDRIEMLRDIARRESEVGLESLARWLVSEKDGSMLKLFVTHKALMFRRSERQLYDTGEYIPLDGHGEKAGHLCAFARRLGNARAITVVPRLLTGLVDDPGTPPLGKTVWKDTILVIPFAEPGARYRDVFTGTIHTVESRQEATSLRLSELLGDFPVALLERVDE